MFTGFTSAKYPNTSRKTKVSVHDFATNDIELLALESRVNFKGKKYDLVDNLVILELNKNNDKNNSNINMKNPTVNDEGDDFNKGFFATTTTTQSRAPPTARTASYRKCRVSNLDVLLFATATITTAATTKTNKTTRNFLPIMLRGERLVATKKEQNQQQQQQQQHEKSYR